MAVRLLKSSMFTSENHENRIIEACLKKFREGRQLEINKKRLNSPNINDLEEIANKLLSEATCVEVIDSLQNEDSNSTEYLTRPSPIIDENDENFAYVSSEDYKSLAHRIMEALEYEISQNKDEYFEYEPEYPSFDENMIEENDESNDSLLCPFCRSVFLYG